MEGFHFITFYVIHYSGGSRITALPHILWCSRLLRPLPSVFRACSKQDGLELLQCEQDEQPPPRFYVTQTKRMRVTLTEIPRGQRPSSPQKSVLLHDQASAQPRATPQRSRAR